MLQTDLIDDMLGALSKESQSMTLQLNIIAEIMEKSNKLLLQIESSTRAQKPTNATESKDAILCSYNKETMQTLAHMIVQFKQLAESSEQRVESTQSFEEYLENMRERLEYLNSSVRKLLAASETVALMKTSLYEDSSDTSGNEADIYEDLSSE